MTPSWCYPISGGERSRFFEPCRRIHLDIETNLQYRRRTGTSVPDWGCPPDALVSSDRFTDP